MTGEITPQTPAPKERKGLRWPQVLLIILVTVVTTAGITYWVVSRYLFQKEFAPIRLKPSEEQVLQQKLQAIGIELEKTGPGAGALTPEPYSEVGASREVRFTEREVNGLLAKNTDLAQRLAFDLSNNLLSAKLLVPLEEDFPILGGKTLRIHAGAELAFQNNRPTVVLRGVSIMGVPIPNAWLGSLKNVDLVREFGGDRGFWKTFADGIEYIRVEEGRLTVKLKE